MTLGDCAFLLADLPAPAWDVAKSIESAHIEGIVEAIASFDTVGVFCDKHFEAASVEDSLHHLAVKSNPFEPRHHTIPVCYELGEDCRQIEQDMNLEHDELADLHSSPSYTCFAIGFCPGFPYLGYLPDQLKGIPRRPNPRIRVPRGSVGITGGQTGIYPAEVPGGWALIGRTPLSIAEAEKDYFPIQPGDQVTFRRIAQGEFERLLGSSL